MRNKIFILILSMMSIIGYAQCVPSATNPDSDGDGIADICDLDDDNDGILDTDECPETSSSFLSYYNSYNSYGGHIENWDIIASAQPSTHGSGLSRQIDTGHSYMELTGINATNVSESITNNEYVEYSFTTLNKYSFVKEIGYYSLNSPPIPEDTQYHFSVRISKDNFLTNDILIMNRSYNANEGVIRLSIEGDKYWMQPNTTYKVRVYFYAVNGGAAATIAHDDFRIYGFIECDTDGDGIPDRLDLDSDNDGCPDTIEGGAAFTSADLVESSMPGGNSGATSGSFNQPVTQNLGNTVNTTSTSASYGVPIVAGSGQTIGTSQTANPVLVAGTAGANQTIASGSTPTALTLTGATGSIQWQVSSDNSAFTNISGATNATYAPGALTVTSYYRAIVTSTGGCTAISNTVIINVNVPCVVSATNPDSDGDGIADSCDLDDDNDGILDTVECSNTITDMANVFAGGNLINIPPSDFGLALNTKNQNVTVDLSDKFGYPVNSGAVIISITNASVHPTQDAWWTKDGEAPSVWSVTGSLSAFVLMAHDTRYYGNDSKTMHIYDAAPVIPIMLPGLENQIPVVGQWSIIDTPTQKSLNNLDNNTSTEEFGNWRYANMNFGSKIFGFSTTTALGDPTYVVQIYLECDTDGDGIPDRLDLDSDNDGCPDAIEGSGNFTADDLTTASGDLTSQSVNQNFGVTIDANGIPVIVGASGQGVGNSKNSNINDCPFPNVCTSGDCNENAFLFTSDPNTLEYDNLVSGFHSTIAKQQDGNYLIWGQGAKPNTFGEHLYAPTLITPDNGFNYTGEILKATLGTRGATNDGSDQYAILTTDGLYIWGGGDPNSGRKDGMVHRTVKDSQTFDKMTNANIPNADPATGLPVGVAPTDVKMLFGSYATLGVVTCTGEAYVLSHAGNKNGDGSTDGASEYNKWHRVSVGPGQPLNRIVAMRGAPGAMVALTYEGDLYTWGTDTYLADGTAKANRLYATQMTLPTGVMPKMIGMTKASTGTSGVTLNSYYLLSTTGDLYSLGDNSEKQLGTFDNIERTTWVNVKSTNASTNMSNIVWISPNEHDAAGHAAVTALTADGKLWGWGMNHGNMLGVGSNAPVDPRYMFGSLDHDEKVLAIETGGHINTIFKDCDFKLGYIGHSSNGSYAINETNTGSYSTVFKFDGARLNNLCAIYTPPFPKVIDLKVCSGQTVNLGDALLNTTPVNYTLEWWTTPDRTPGTQVLDPANAPAGTYYAFFSRDIDECSNITGEPVVVSNYTSTDPEFLNCVCYRDPVNNGTGSETKMGITLLKRAGSNDPSNWPMVRKSGHIALESNTQGFVVTRIAKADLGNITNPQEGMMVYDTTDKCLKIYSDNAWKCFSTPACP